MNSWMKFMMVNYHFIVYLGFLFVFFGGLNLPVELFDVTSLVFGLDSSLPEGTFACMVSCFKPAVISATLSLCDFRLFSNCDAGSNLIGVCARIWFWPSDPTGWLWNVDMIIFTDLSMVRSPRDGAYLMLYIGYITCQICYVVYDLRIMKTIPMKLKIAWLSFQLVVHFNQTLILLQRLSHQLTNKLNQIYFKHCITWIVEKKSHINITFCVLK